MGKAARSLEAIGANIEVLLLLSKRVEEICESRVTNVQLEVTNDFELIPRRLRSPPPPPPIAQ